MVCSLPINSGLLSRFYYLSWIFRVGKDLDNYHTISVTKCLTSLQGFQYTATNRSDQASHEKIISKRMGLSINRCASAGVCYAGGVVYRRRHAALLKGESNSGVWSPVGRRLRQRECVCRDTGQGHTLAA